MANTIQGLPACDIPARLDGVGSANLEILKCLLEKEKIQHIHIEMRRRIVSHDVRTFEELACRIFFLEAPALVDGAPTDDGEPPVYVLAPGVDETLRLR
jgi:hypothetical protein